jgi:hypothetical protein
MKSLKINARNHNGKNISIDLNLSDTTGLTFEFKFHHDDGTPVTELDRDADDFFGFMEQLVNHTQQLAAFLEKTSSDDNGDISDATVVGVVN